MDIPNTRPSILKPGDTIGIIAPAGPIASQEALAAGIATLERMGFRVFWNERILQSYRYFAGRDVDRAEELMRFFEDPGIQGIIALRGGYGCSRLIPLLEERRLRPHCKVFMGFSDLTTLHLFFRRRFGWVTFYGPMAATPALGYIGIAEQNHLQSLWTDPAYMPDLRFPGLESWKPGIAEGRVVGGCLSLITASLGTIYEIRTEGKILFLEDLGEPPYRIDRMLNHLHLAGKLNSIAGVILGSFIDCETEPATCSLKETFMDIFDRLQIPVLANFPCGHGQVNWAIPLGTRIRLDATDPSIQFLESSVSC
ncbi:MAG: LD-carboxypeptidase [Acidobacteria bacterium]|jgi:muramoyltetrapeptide carboxypeptidase|nr:LD-carboxypeptidase [Acidobacteriota bacterium]